LSGAADDLAERLARCYSGAVFDALRERGIDDTILPSDIRPLDETRVMAGPVFTVLGSPKPDLDAHASLLAWTDFLSRAPAGHVVVLQGRDGSRALMGELSAETLQARGVRGFLSDGGCRDCAFIRRIGFPVAARFFTPRDVVAAWSPDAFDVPVMIGDVRVSPGDYLIADIDGAVAIPGALAADVVAEVEQVMRTENAVRAAIRSGVDPKEAYLRFGRF
jgi:regulator of RNase E activity RraA